MTEKGGEYISYYVVPTFKISSGGGVTVTMRLHPTGEEFSKFTLEPSVVKQIVRRLKSAGHC